MRLPMKEANGVQVIDRELAIWMSGKQVDACIECGECEEKCPQNIQIKDQLKEAHRALSQAE